MNLFVFNNKSRTLYKMKIFIACRTASKILLLLTLLMFYSCRTKRMNKHISRMANETKQVDFFDFEWRIKHYFENEDFDYYIVDYQKPDTFISLKFKHFKDEGEYKIEEYYKSYINQEDNRYYSLKWCYDTLYFSYDMDAVGQNREFIVGKYYYLYENNRFTPNQREYFKLYRDSLIKVRGDDLPELPEFD